MLVHIITFTHPLPLSAPFSPRLPDAPLNEWSGQFGFVNTCARPRSRHHSSRRCRGPRLPPACRQCRHAPRLSSHRPLGSGPGLFSAAALLPTALHPARIYRLCAIGALSCILANDNFCFALSSSHELQVGVRSVSHVFDESHSLPLVFCMSSSDEKLVASIACRLSLSAGGRQTDYE